MVARSAKAATKYTPLREVLEGKRVILVEDSIVRSTTMNVLLDRIREVGGAKEIHVRVACPPIIAPCFYGIDMSTIDQLIAPKYFTTKGILTPEAQQRLADDLGPIHCSIFPSIPSHVPLGNPPVIFAKPVSRANTQRSVVNRFIKLLLIIRGRSWIASELTSSWQQQWVFPDFACELNKPFTFTAVSRVAASMSPHRHA